MNSRQSVELAGGLAPLFRGRVSWLCAAVLLVEGYDIAAAGYVVPLLVDVWHVSLKAFTWALVAGNIGLLIGSLIAGSLGDRIGRRPVLIVCVVVFGVLSLVSAFATSPGQLAVARILTGVGLGGALPLAIALVADIAPAVIKGRSVMLTSLGIPLGFVLAGMVSRHLGGAFGWTAVFVAGGVVPLFLVPLLLLYLPESKVDRAAPSLSLEESVKALFHDGRACSTALVWSINFLNLLATYFLLLWTPAILHEAGANPSAAIIASTTFSLGIVASPALTAPVVDRLGIDRVVAVTLAIGACSILTIAICDARFGLLVLLLFGAGVGAGAQGAINALSGLMYPPAIRATGAGWALGFGRIGGVTGPFLGGTLLAHGFSVHQLYALASVPVFTALILVAVLGRLALRGGLQ
jgi:MFS transporter, AAHS family, 4-hydroxybenzoate transporter